MEKSNQLILERVSLAILGGALGFWGASLAGPWKWFSYHPVSMSISFISLGGAATLTKKLGGFQNTKLHGFMMGIAAALSTFGFWVIYSNKNLLKRAHFTTNHGKLGLVVSTAFIILAAFSSGALDPSWGFLKTNKAVRLAHKWGGRALIALGWATFTGFATLQQHMVLQFLVMGLLVISSLFTLL
jgi:hypothetical protein